MASSGGSSASGPTVERIVSEGVLSAARIILEARLPTVARPAEPQQHRPWFNIEVQEVEGAAKALERWRREGPSLPLVLEVFLQPWGAQAGGQDRAVETLLERWVVHYYPTLPEGPSHLSRSHLSRLNPQSVYKRLVITLRSLYTYLRVLPAYRMYRACKRQRGATFTLGYRLHSTLPGASAATAPGSRRMQSFKFGSVETPYGQLRISVAYQPASTVTILEQTTSPPPLPQIIADYVGGGHSGHSSGAHAGGHAGGGGGNGRALRHAMSASVVGAGALPSAYPSPSPPQGAGLGPAGSPQGPGSVGRTAGGLPIRRSWSTTMRAAAPSPHRTLSQTPGELPSPTLDTPYGSAPQAVSLPAMLRTLSTSAGKYTVGSPSGRPPLAKPPRGPPAAAGPLPVPAARPPLGSSPGSRGGHAFPGTAGAAAAGPAAEEEDADDEMAGSPGGSAGSAPRQITAPMSIPGRGEELGGAPTGRGRRLRSSNDLWAMQHAAAMHKPLSAPAVSHMHLPAATSGRAAGGGGGGAAGAAAAVGGAASARGSRAGADPSEPSRSPPPARLPTIPCPMDCESSGSAASSLYPTSCSPQLPFAFTPSAQSMASFGARSGAGGLHGLERVSPRLGRTPFGTPGGASVPQQAALHQMRALAAAGGAGGGAAAGVAPASSAAAAAAPAPGTSGGSSAGFSPSSGGSSGGGVVGREVPASTALMRRPSWSSRSSAFGPLAGEASQPGVGYSVSPMQDPALESLLGGSTPRQYSLATAGLPSPLAPAGLQLPAGGRGLGRPGGSVGALALLTYPSVSPEISGALDEMDVLPFALDEGSASPFKPRSPANPSPPLPPSPEDHALPISTAAGALLGGPPVPAASPAAAAPPAATAAPAAPAAQAPVDSDAAVGAFVRLIQDAPPLRLHASRAGMAMRRAGSAADLASLQGPAPGTSSGSDSSGATCLSDGRGLTLQAGLRQFSALRERLQQRGVMVGPCP